jgi:hypothetical protein
LAGACAAAGCGSASTEARRRIRPAVAVVIEMVEIRFGGVRARGPGVMAGFL